MFGTVQTPFSKWKTPALLEEAQRQTFAAFVFHLIIRGIRCICLLSPLDSSQLGFCGMSSESGAMGIKHMGENTAMVEQKAGESVCKPQELLPLVYDDLRRLAAAKMSLEGSDSTLQPTALVHEAWLRLLGSSQQSTWQNRAHFFA